MFYGGAPKAVLEMVDKDVLCQLSVEILETENKLGYGFAGSLFNCVKLAKQFAYGDNRVPTSWNVVNSPG